jgi:hypothetical protein
MPVEHVDRPLLERNITLERILLPDSFGATFYRPN